MLTDNILSVRKFAFQIGYDKTSNTAGQGFTAAQYNGNIAGIVWKSSGDGIRRKYDFTYDNANRLMQANFVQNNGGTTVWDNTQVNYNVKMGDGNSTTSAYDNNGNIIRMQQWGLKIGSSSQIDNLTYNYTAKTNKLLNVADGFNDAQTTMGDFRVSVLNPVQTKTTTTVDYTYDANGNMLKDLNKDIGTASASGIVYNYLNLPQAITVQKSGGVKGTITYTCDAAGNKLKKVTIDYSTSGKIITTTTTYVAGFVYESKLTSPANTPNDDYTDVLQFVSHEEGRIRFEKATTATCAPKPDRFIYDYFIKDHLGNVRMVLTEQQEDICYIPATVEDSRYVTEQQIYDIVDGRRILKSSTGATQASFENKLYQTHGNIAGQKTGLGVTLKVMAGDKVKITAESFYSLPSGGSSGSVLNMTLTDLLTAFTASGAITSLKPGATTSVVQNISTNTADLTNFLSRTPAVNTPKAYLNWVLFDEQLKYVSSGADPVATGSTSGGGFYKQHVAFTTPVSVTKNGFMYVFVSNESNLAVFFDNLNLTHTPGSLLEETHYYPFGLTMAGISSKAAGGLGNKRGFHGKEMQNKELSDGSGLELYDFGAREQDPQIGRWSSIDPLAYKRHWLTPYNFVQNNPLIRVDPKGETDFKLNEKTGEFTQVGEKNDKPDRMLQTDRKGEVKKKGEGFLGFLVKKSERGNPKVAIGNIEKGILKDGINFQNASNVIDVGGASQPSVKGVQNFLLALSNHIDKEISGYNISRKSESSISNVYINPYKDNDATTAKGGFDLYSIRPDLKDNVNVQENFHTHLSRFDDNSRLTPSKADLDSKENDMKSGVQNFIIITNPDNIPY